MYRVMIVEDDKTNQRFYEKLKVWEEEGFVIAGQASHGKEALALMEQNEYDFYLVDVMMPVMNGLEFLQELKDRGVDAPKIIASNYNEFEYVRQGMKLGAMDYLLKPITEDALRECLQSVREELWESRDGKIMEQIFQACGSDTESGFTKKLMAYFAEHTRDLNLKDISDEFLLSKDYFGKLFKRQMNENFNQFVLKYKMEYACYLLKDTDDRIYEISDALGYKTTDYFSKLFKEYTGQTPAGYRKDVVTVHSRVNHFAD